MGKAGAIAPGERMDESKRPARVLDIIYEIVCLPRRWTRAGLAAKYEVCEREIQRDLAIIRHGLKLDLRHCREGYYFASIPRLPTITYSLSEALALILAVQAGSQFGVDSGELVSAIGRLESAFPAEFRPLLRSRSLVSVAGGAGADKGTLSLLGQALAQRRKLRLVYAVANRQGELTERVVRPYCLLPYGRTWYLVAHCESRGAMRVFRVERIRELSLLNESFTIPEDFSLEQAMGPAWGLMWGAAGPEEEVRLRFDAEAGRWLGETEYHPSQQVAQEADGGVLVTFRIGVTPEFVRWLLFFAGHVEVLAPAHLRQAVAAEHRRGWEENG